MTQTSAAAPDRYQKLIDIGVALSAERDHARLSERILIEAMEICNADGGTLYLLSEDERQLKFEIVRNRSLGIALGGTTGRPVEFPPLPLYDPEGPPNHANVATHAVLARKTVNLGDAYLAPGFDFSGTRRFDTATGYRSRSFLTVPLANRRGAVVGVLQLINATAADGKVAAFDAADQAVVEALASQAAVAIENESLLRGQRALLEAFIKVIAMAIDRKSPYTSGHCQRVPVLTEMLAEAANAATSGPFAGFTLDAEQMYALHIAGWMHDCGKVTTPEYVVDKSTKLETIYDRIELVATRFEVLKREAEIARLAGRISAADAAARIAQYDSDRVFLAEINRGGEAMSDTAVERLGRIAKYQWRGLDSADGAEQDFLTPDEHDNLAIRRGTLNASERAVINDHIVATIEMLEALPFPKHLRHVPEYAGGHHEKMDGTGYPKKLTREQMSAPARMMAIADIFEALTAADRPYKAPMKLSQAMAIMTRMKADHHVDPELFDLFVTQKVYRAYADKFLRPDQIDAVDEAAALAAKPRPIQRSP
ncbi:MAG: GAF domain-containing protein [Alphaproteobacteria bacterium]|nr:GAF domain-containing protein [Alphaproteobacteria bacterium]